MKRSIAGFTAVSTLTAVVLIGGAGEAGATSTTFVLSSKSGWVRVPLSLERGHEYTLSTSGSWTVDHRNFPRVESGGYSEGTDAKIFQGCKINSNLPYGMLLGKFGDDEPFAAGPAGTFTYQGRGSLFVRINDDERCFGDNAGQITVRVTSRTLPLSGSDRAPLMTRDALNRAWECGLSAAETKLPNNFRVLVRAAQASRNASQAVAAGNLMEAWLNIGLPLLPFSECIDPLFHPPEVS
ncbi:hypothetical protein [Streptomyces regalis]|uniref:hypothetical protein n=1 Tax=Streptomyces regalis TaxID=68262 RepID=UPI00131C3751|nr:hypothetical protein [Streptomyces regalis]